MFRRKQKAEILAARMRSDLMSAMYSAETAYESTCRHLPQRKDAIEACHSVLNDLNRNGECWQTRGSVLLRLYELGEVAAISDIDRRLLRDHRLDKMVMSIRYINEEPF